MKIEEKDYKKLFELIGATFFYGDFVAETYNEREIEKILRKYGYFFETEDELMKKLHPGDNKMTKKKKDNWWKRFLKWIEKASKKEPPDCGNCR